MVEGNDLFNDKVQSSIAGIGIQQSDESFKHQNNNIKCNNLFVLCTSPEIRLLWILIISNFMNILSRNGELIMLNIPNLNAVLVVIRGGLFFNDLNSEHPKIKPCTENANLNNYYSAYFKFLRIITLIPIYTCGENFKNCFCVKFPVFPSLYFVFLDFFEKCLLLLCIMHQVKLYTLHRHKKKTHIFVKSIYSSLRSESKKKKTLKKLNWNLLFLSHSEIFKGFECLFSMNPVMTDNKKLSFKNLKDLYTPEVENFDRSLAELKLWRRKLYKINLPKT
ncbi:hypothetical protein AGLY_012422 [Aphis glycines]|uniref:Uncharacterized protein n=1 Tax=Aphis glycines TaxID=307491 RepID=A0A6G0TA07_APHGL|nr:hypothetical protein AGLY_012422 [Aphis glycines]